MDTEGLDEDVQELFRYKDDGTVEVHGWISDVLWNFFSGQAQVCKDGELENEDMSVWTRKPIGKKIWQDVLEGVEASNANTKNIMQKSTYFLKHVVSEKEGTGAIAVARIY